MMDSPTTPKTAASAQRATKPKAAPATKARAKKATPAATKPTVKKPKSAPAATPVTAKASAKSPAKMNTGGKAPKVKRKLVRDSFTMPQADFELIDVLKQRALNFRHSVKKSELLRAGLQVLAALPQAQLQAALERITALKPGRPKKND